MNRSSRKVMRFLLSVLGIILLLASSFGCTPPQRPVLGFKPKLSISEPPVLGKPVKVSLAFTGVALRGLEGRDTYYLASILLGGDFELVGGSLEQKGLNVAGESHVLEATIRSTHPTGAAMVYGMVGVNLSENETNRYGDFDVLYIDITEDEARVSRTPIKYHPKGGGTTTPIPVFPSTLTPTLSPSSGPPVKSPSILGGASYAEVGLQDFNPRLSISEPPVLGKPVKVTLEFTGTTQKGLEGRDTYYLASLELTPGVLELVEGSLEQKGRNTPGESHTLEATIVAKRLSRSATIYGRVSMHLSANETRQSGDFDMLFIDITPDGAKVSRTQPTDEIGGYPVLDGANPNVRLSVMPYDKAEPPTPTVHLPSANATSKQSTRLETRSLVHPLTVMGKFWAYISKNEAGQMFADELQPIVWGVVEIFDTQGNLLGQGLTGTGTGQPFGANAGEYSITIENPYSLGFKVRITPDSSGATIRDGWGNHYYAYYVYAPVPYSVPAVVCPDATPSNESDAHKGAWRIYESLVNDVYNRGAWYFLASSPRGPHWEPPTAVVNWPVDPVPVIVPDPPCYDAWVTLGIYLNQDSHTQGLDTIQHEYAHFIMHGKMYGYDPASPIQPANHYLWQSSSAELGWTEGWADFFPLVVQDNAYLDPGVGSSGDLEYKDWTSVGWKYVGGQWGWGPCEYGDSVEGRVAGALWDIYDLVYDGYDTYYGQFQNVWAAFFASPSSVRTFAAFWDQLKWRFPDQIPPARALFQNTIVYPEAWLYLTTSVSPPSSGSVFKNPDWPSYPRNTQVTLTAIPNPGWQFVNWTGSVTSTANPVSLIMDFDKTVTANFVQAQQAPTLTTNPATAVTANSAMLNAYVSSLGGAGSVTCSFEWGLTTSYGYTATGVPSSLYAPGSFSAGPTGLSPNTTYHFRAKAVGNGTAYGADQQFTTAPAGSNPLINSSFELGNPPNDWLWVQEGTLASRSQSSEHVSWGSYALKVVSEGGKWAHVYQFNPNHSAYAGKTVTLTANVWCAMPNRAHIAVDDGISGATSAYHPGDGQFHRLSVTFTLSTGITRLNTEMDINGNGNSTIAYFDDAILAVSPLTNPGFELGNPPNGWNVYQEGTSASISRSTEHISQGTYALKGVSEANKYVHIAQFNPDYLSYAGKTVTLSADVWSATPNRVFIDVDDGISGAASPFHPGDGQFHKLSVTFTLSPGITRLNTEMDINGNGSSTIAYFDAVILEVNPLTNPDFELGNPPNGWNVWQDGSSASIARSTDHVSHGTYAMKVINESGRNVHVFQLNPYYAAYAGRTVTLSSDVWCAIQNRVHIIVDDGISGGISTYHPGDGQFHRLSVTLTLSPGITRLNTEMDIDGSGGSIAAYFDDVTLVTN